MHSVKHCNAHITGATFHKKSQQLLLLDWGKLKVREPKTYLFSFTAW